MTELPLYPKREYSMGAIYGGIDVDSKRGESESVVVVSDICTELCCF
jgi:Rieske Fe-S protein